jgi:hypothetical protein
LRPRLRLPRLGIAEVARTLAAPDATDSLLFVARSDRGLLAVRSGAGSTLDLDGVDSVTWFFDHPARNAPAPLAHRGQGCERHQGERDQERGDAHWCHVMTVARC